MSDQFTRITCGGSALPKDAPVVGLLFGRRQYLTFAEATTTTPKAATAKQSSKKNNHKTSRDDDDDDDDVTKKKTTTATSAAAGCLFWTQIVDADDIPTDRSETAKIQVSLHKAVFPQHEVVGWYRVGSENEPTSEDLVLTQELKSHYLLSSTETTSTTTTTTTTTTNQPFFFALLQVRPSSVQDSAAPVAGATNKGNKSSSNNNTMKDDNNNNDDDEDDDDELPLNLYEVQQDVLVGVEDWSLETSEAERIAVERVVREKPQQDLMKTTSQGAVVGAGNNNNNNAAAVAAADIEAAAATMASQSQLQLSSPYVGYMSTVQQSLEAMDDRIQLIIDYLERMGKGEIPSTNYNLSLMRQIQGLILQLGPLQQQASLSSSSGSTPVSERDAALLSHLAVLTKTIQSVQSYSDKFRVLNDNQQTTGGGREGGRRGY